MQRYFLGDICSSFLSLILFRRLEERRRGRPYESRAPISLGAVYETVCRNCGIRGHLASDCFHRPGSSRLGLVYSSDGGSSDGYDGPKGGSSRKFKRSDNAIRGSPNRMRRFNEYRPNDEGRSEYNRNYDSRKRKHTDQQHGNNFEYKRKQSPS
ncbi:unnamed protein product [Dicrocoelium dendriticum]|nr:unnamed protein product [Dicrocoelium dendriticum]